MKLIGPIIATLITAGSVAAQTNCTVRFDVITAKDHGTIAAGSLLSGTVTFAATEEYRQDVETLSYLSNGTTQLTAADGTQVTGNIGVVHVVRTPYTADYISIDATGVTGNLGGVESYEDPMLVTLYAAPLTLQTSALPATSDDWNLLSKRRMFQVHTPDTMAILPGTIENLTGSCE